MEYPVMNEDDVYRALAEKIKYEREKRGWSQVELGNKAKTSHQNISRYENGSVEKIPIKVLMAIAMGAFNIPIDQFIRDAIDNKMEDVVLDK